MTILLDTATVHGIPVLTLMPDDAEHRPAIFFVHGFGDSKEAGLHLGYQMKLKIYPAGHGVTPQLERDAVDWFTTHLI